jgi:hypothetical protein
MTTADSVTATSTRSSRSTAFSTPVSIASSGKKPASIRPTPSVYLLLTHLIVTNNLAGLSFFLSLGADVEARLPAFDIIGLNGDGFGLESELDPTRSACCRR